MLGRKPLTVNEKVTFTILFALLFIRIALQPLFFWWLLPDNIGMIWFNYFLTALVYVLTSVIIWLNKNHLKRLHIDRLFIDLFIGAGILLVTIYLPYQLGIFVGLATFITFLSLYTRKFVFRRNRLKYREVFIFFVLIIAILFGPISLIAIFFHANIPWGTSPLDVKFLKANFPGVVYEEVLFRGTLWMFLNYLISGKHQIVGALGKKVKFKNAVMRNTWKKQKIGPKKVFLTLSSSQKLTSLRFKNKQIIFIQAFLFWLSHYYYYQKLYIFWIALPIMSLIFGIMVNRSKSLTSSTIAHFAVNVLVSL